MSRGLELSASPPDLREGGRERGWRLNQFSVASNSINNVHVMNQYPKGQGLENFQSDHTGRC